MKAISIQQPWAWLIVNGHKDIENRTWKSNFKGRVLIHAGKKLDMDFPWDHLAVNYPKCPIRPNYPVLTGGIVGEATIIDCVEESESEWFNGPYGFVLKDARPLPFAPCKGSLGFFDISPEQLKQC